MSSNNNIKNTSSNNSIDNTLSNNSSNNSLNNSNNDKSKIVLHMLLVLNTTNSTKNNLRIEYLLYYVHPNRGII
jgi:hypothetical protein